MLYLVETSSRRKQLGWLRAVQEATGWNQSELARRAGISHATISRFKNDPDNSSELETSTVSKIAAVSPIPHYENTRAAMPEGFDEGEAIRYDESGDPLVERAVAAMKDGSNQVEPWVLKTDALENVGYRPGDILIVDFSSAPRAGDVVCAQIYDMNGGAETAFRLYFKPFLMSSSNSLRHQAPTIIDDRVDVRGVVVASVRPRITRLAS